MTSPLRRKRPITRPSSKAPTALNSLVLSLAALAAATSLALPARAEAQWRPARRPALPAESDAPQAALPAPSAQNDAPSRSVVVRRSTAADQYDPFEEDDRAAPARVAALQPADPFDPFEVDPGSAPNGAADQQPAPAEQPAPAPEAEEPVDQQVESAAEPSPQSPPESEDSPIESEAPAELEQTFEPPQPPVDVESPDALLEEVERGAADELVKPSAPDLPEPEPMAPDDEMVDELPGSQEPDFDFENDVDVDDDLQYGGQFGDELPPLTPEQEEARRQELERDRIQSEKNCERILENVKANRITNINLDIKLKGNPGEDFPFECGMGDERFEPRAWSEITYLWKASGLCHKPLYFEQVQLERYGHSWGPVLQPIMSGAHFFGTVPLLPYKMGVEPPTECIYALGYYRPGNCAPYMIPAVPLSLRGAAYEAGAATGLILIFP